ncbi:DNA repair protein RecO [Aestuariispira ectoiniformans]|uniref:DNA repair protein RecO n=1 Tax=Aestuariispira ectoiniformans TaxID=2775080 RepID=UPI00223B8F0C|nr:DNA repair protein RecO [Aestuariispira ectoiniformans]
MEWVDEGIVLGLRRHGESSAILTAFTRRHGRHTGLVRGATSKRLRGVLQPGNRLQLSWRGRLEEHLGHFEVELLDSHAAALMLDAGKLAALTSACALIDFSLPERETHPQLYETLNSLAIALDHEAWAETYVKWEIGLLAELGFGLDLSACAATGQTTDLVYVSPKTARAVSRQAGEPYRDKLLPLPGFLIGEGGADDLALASALKMTGYFLNRHVYTLHGRSLPDSRMRLLQRFLR